MITLYGQNGRFETEVLKRRLKVPYTFKAVGIDFNIDTLKSQYGKVNIPAVIKDDKVLSESEIETLINGVSETVEITKTPEAPKSRRRTTKMDQ
jgi:hypothetical protein